MYACVMRTSTQTQAETQMQCSLLASMLLPRSLAQQHTM